MSTLLSGGAKVAASWLCMLLVGAGTRLMAGLLFSLCAVPSGCPLSAVTALVFAGHGIDGDVSVSQKKLFL